MALVMVKVVVSVEVDVVVGRGSSGCVDRGSGCRVGGRSCGGDIDGGGGRDGGGGGSCVSGGRIDDCCVGRLVVVVI